MSRRRTLSVVLTIYLGIGALSGLVKATNASGEALRSGAAAPGRMAARVSPTATAAQSKAAPETKGAKPADLSGTKSPSPTAPAKDVMTKGSLPAHGKIFTYKSGADDVSAYMAVPDEAGPHPAVIVIHEWWGLNDQIKGVADAMASKGYVAVAPDLYRGHATADPKIAMELMNAMPESRAINDLAALFTYVQTSPAVKSMPIGSIGFCMGGHLSLLLAITQPQLAACVVCYGRPETDPSRLEKIKAPLLGLYGGADQGIPEKSVEDFKAQMTKMGKPVEIKIFPGAGHGFLNTNNATYNAEAAKEVWPKIDAFLQATMASRKGNALPGVAPAPK